MGVPSGYPGASRKYRLTGRDATSEQFIQKRARWPCPCGISVSTTPLTLFGSHSEGNVALFLSLHPHAPLNFFPSKAYMKWENKPLAPVQPHIHRPALKIAFANHWHLQTVWCLGRHVIPQCFVFLCMTVSPPHLSLRPAVWS